MSPPQGPLQPGVVAPGVVAPAGVLCLERIEEPGDLRVVLRAAALAGAGARQGVSDGAWLGAWLWDRWRPCLEPAGMDRDTFLDVVVGYRRELWLWLLGDRGWGQLVAGLAGRVARRLPAA